MKWFVMWDFPGDFPGDPEDSGFSVFDDEAKARAFFEEAKDKSMGRPNGQVTLARGCLIRTYDLTDGKADEATHIDPDGLGAHAVPYDRDVPNTAYVVRVNSEVVSGWLAWGFDFMQDPPKWGIINQAKSAAAFATKDEAEKAAEVMNRRPERFRARAT